MLRVLVVEDDAEIADTVRESLSEHGYQVTTCASGLEALAALAGASPDLLVLDLGLPDVDGERVLTMIRVASAVPIIVASARGDDADIVRVLNLGADDYVVKPFTVEQLEARIRAVVRRATEVTVPVGQQVWEIGDLRVDVGRHQVTIAGCEIPLGRKEFEILAVLARGQGMVTPRSTVMEEVWGESGPEAERRLEVHLTGLRTKLGETGREPRYLHSVRGVGLRLEPAVGV